MKKPLIIIFSISLIVFIAFKYLGLPGLDFRNPGDSKEWIRACASSTEDNYCKSASRIVRGIKGPIIFLIPNTSEIYINEKILSLYGNLSDEKIDLITRANLFRGSKLVTGNIQSLDGQIRQVRCINQEPPVCSVDNLKVGLSNKPANLADGSVYSIAASSEGQIFLLPKSIR